MSSYTTDMIHIQSGWHHLVPALIGFAFMVFFAVLAWRRQELFPRAKWVPSILLALAIPITGLLFCYGMAANIFSVHASNLMEREWSQDNLVGEIESRTGLKLPQEAKVEAAVTMGAKDHVYWFAVRGKTNALSNQLLERKFERNEVQKQGVRTPRPEPIDNWIRQSAFQPQIVFSKLESRRDHTIYIDHSQGLMLVVTGRF